MPQSSGPIVRRLAAPARSWPEATGILGGSASLSVGWCGLLVPALIRSIEATHDRSDAEFGVSIGRGPPPEIASSRATRFPRSSSVACRRTTTSTSRSLWGRSWPSRCRSVRVGADQVRTEHQTHELDHSLDLRHDHSRSDLLGVRTSSAVQGAWAGRAHQRASSRVSQNGRDSRAGTVREARSSLHRDGDHLSKAPERPGSMPAQQPTDAAHTGTAVQGSAGAPIDAIRARHDGKIVPVAPEPRWARQRCTVSLAASAMISSA